jgi:hypothetical protein
MTWVNQKITAVLAQWRANSLNYRDTLRQLCGLGVSIDRAVALMEQ